MITVRHPEALGWKHPGVGGISTRAGVLTEWPESLGPEPTQAEVNQWEAEWLQFTNDPVNSPTTIKDVIDALAAAGVTINVNLIKQNRV